jgi:type I restriction enzyme M protein
MVSLRKVDHGAPGGAPRRRKAAVGQPALPLNGTVGTPESEHLTISQLETWLWDAACAIRGAQDAPKFKDFILPLLFFKRLSDAFDDRFADQVATFGDAELAQAVVEQDHLAALKAGRQPTIGVYIPEPYRWGALRNHPVDTHLGEFVTEAMREVANLNPALDGVLNVKDFNETQSGHRTLDDDRLAALIEVLSRYRIGLKDAEADILGRAYEYLLRKFAEGQGQSAGEFYTPKEVGQLMALLIEVPPYATVYDPTCGSGGLLIKARMAFEMSHLEQRTAAPKLYGQELNPTTYAIAKMNMLLHGYESATIATNPPVRPVLNVTRWPLYRCVCQA